MEVLGDGVGPTQVGPLTSTPVESSPPSLPTRTNSSSESSESEEDWLIKVCCPGARHRYRKHTLARKANISMIPSPSTSTGIPDNMDKEDNTAENIEWMPPVPFEDFTRVPKKESTDLQWLIRVRCPRAQMEQLMREPNNQPVSGVSTPLSKSQSKIDESAPLEKTKPSQSWLTQKHLSIAQGSASLESYSPSSYDPFFLKRNPDVWKVSLPPLHDPLLKEIQERYTETSIIYCCDTGKSYSFKEMNELFKLPELPSSRQLLDPTEWFKIPFQYVESDIRRKSR